MLMQPILLLLCLVGGMAYPSFMLKEENCGRRLEVGSTYMGQTAISDNFAFVVVSRGKETLASGDAFKADEILNISVVLQTQAHLLFETSDASFVTDVGSIGCGLDGTRLAFDRKQQIFNGILKIPPSTSNTSDTVSIVAAWSSSYGAVHIGPKFYLHRSISSPLQVKESPTELPSESPVIEMPSESPITEMQSEPDGHKLSAANESAPYLRESVSTTVTMFWNYSWGWYGFN